MKKTLLSFLCIGATCIALGQQTRPVSDPNKTNVNPTPNSTLNNSTTPASPVTQPSPNSNTNQPVNTNTNVNVNTMDNSNMTTSGTLSSTTNSAAYSVSVPASVQTTFTTAYPAAGSVTWQQSGDWYRARYRENGRLMEASYREDGKSFTRAASPVLRTYVPEEVVNKALDMYGMNVYAIAMTKGAEGQSMYNVTLIENGQSKTEWMNEDGSTVMSPYRTEADDASANMNNNATQQTSTTETIPAEQALDNTEPVDNSNMQDDMIDEPGEQRIIEQGEEQQQLDPDNQMNTEGINNGTTSEETLKNQTSDETLDEETPSYETLDDVEVNPESSDNSPVLE
jgi:hypothetical protein